MEGLSAGERARVDRGNGQRDRGRRRGERHERVTVPCSEYGGRAVSLRRRAPRPPSHVRDGRERRAVGSTLTSATVLGAKIMEIADESLALLRSREQREVGMERRQVDVSFQGRKDF